MTHSEKALDILIIGGGPAGLAAGIYAIRARRKCLIMDKVFPGGQLMYTALIENYPGFPNGSTGMDLASAMAEQVQRLGVEIIMEEAKGIEKAPGGFLVKTSGKTFHTKGIVIATGASWKRLDVPGERELSGKGISYCATCDAPLYRDKDVTLVGGGDTALCEALYLTRFVKHLHLVHRRDALRGEKILQERIFANEKISIIWDSVVTKILGTSSVKAVEILNKKTNKTQMLPTEGVFIFIGNIPNTGFVPDFVSRNEQGQIVTNMKMETNVPGIYAAGDVRAESIRQVIAAAGDGATAAWYADKYLDSLE
jgi:thioredoxin reductase (NADPH)